MTEAEKERVPASAWWMVIGLAGGAAVVALALDLDSSGYLLVLPVGLFGAYWLLRSVQR